MRPRADRPGAHERQSAIGERHRPAVVRAEHLTRERGELGGRQGPVGNRRAQCLDVHSEPWLVTGEQVDAGLVTAVIERDVQPAGHQPLLQVAAAAAAGADADQIDRAVTDVVVAVAAEILCREFPVARYQPFLDAAQYFGAAVAAVPAVEREVEIADKIAEIFEKGRRHRVPAGPHRALVEAELRDLDQTPLRFVELLVIGLAEIWDADQFAVGAVAPAVVRAGENRRRALVVAAHLHAAVATRIEEDMDFARPVAAQNHRFLTHARHKEIPRLRDLALVADEQPRAGKEPLQLFPVDLLVNKDLAADLPCRHIDETGPIPLFTCGHDDLQRNSSTPAKAGAHFRHGSRPAPGRPARLLTTKAKKRRSGSWSVRHSGPTRSCGARSAIRPRSAAADPRACRPGCRSRSRRGCGRSGTGI